MVVESQRRPKFVVMAVETLYAQAAGATNEESASLNVTCSQLIRVVADAGLVSHARKGAGVPHAGIGRSADHLGSTSVLGSGNHWMPLAGPVWRANVATREGVIQ
jgi:hypothetical protein